MVEGLAGGREEGGRGERGGREGADKKNASESKYEAKKRKGVE